MPMPSVQRRKLQSRVSDQDILGKQSSLWNYLLSECLLMDEERNKRVESLGWLTESTVLPKRHKAIEGVGPSSILELKAHLYKSQEEAKKVKDLASDVEFHRAKKKVSHDVLSQKNSGVEARATRDKIQLKAEKDGSASYAALERKAELYDKLLKGELPDEEDKERYCVDFFSKSTNQSEYEPCGNGDTSEMQPTKEDNEADEGLPWAKAVGPGRMGIAVDHDEHKRYVREVHEEANEARDKALTLKMRRQAQAASHREKLRQAYLRKQLEKLKAAKAEEAKNVGAEPAGE